MVNKLTFEELPQALAQLCSKIENIERLLERKPAECMVPADELLTVHQAADFLSISAPTLYGLMSKGEVPVMKRSKRCYFLKSDLIAYLKEGRRKTVSEVQAEAKQYIHQTKRG